MDMPKKQSAPNYHLSSKVHEGHKILVNAHRLISKIEIIKSDISSLLVKSKVY